MKKVKYPNLDDYDLSCYEELKGDILYRINGGAEIENSVEAQAQAHEGDTVKRSDGTTHTLTKGDIKWAQDYVGSNGNTGAAGGGSGSEQGNSTVNIGASTGSQSCVPAIDHGAQVEMASKEASKKQGGIVANDLPDSRPPVSAEDNDGYPSYVDSKNRVVYGNVKSRKSMEEAYAAYSVLCYNGYTFKAVDCGKVVKTFTGDKAAKEYVNDLYSSNGNLSEMLADVSTNAGITNIVTDRIIDRAGAMPVATKLSKFSGAASKVSFATGFTATVIDGKKCLKNPTFRNISNLNSDLVGFIPDIGPFVGIGVSYASEEVAEVAQCGVQLASKELKYEYMMSSLSGDSGFSVISVNNMNLSTIVKSSYLQGLDWFFGEE